MAMFIAVLAGDSLERLTDF